MSPRWVQYATALRLGTAQTEDILRRFNRSNACLLIFCTGILALGMFVLHLPIAALRTLSVVSIVFGSQATIYAIRERTHFLGLRPTLWLLGSSVADIAIISTFALRGIAMSPLSLSLLGGELAAAVLFGLVLNGVKIPIFRKLQLA